MLLGIGELTYYQVSEMLHHLSKGVMTSVMLGTADMCYWNTNGREYHSLRLAVLYVTSTQE